MCNTIITSLTIKNRFFIKKVDMLYISYTNGYKVILEKLYKKYKKKHKKSVDESFYGWYSITCPWDRDKNFWKRVSLKERRKLKKVF